jgi:hypothetical protein
MYIAGLNVPISLNQGVEGAVALVTLIQFVKQARIITQNMKRAEEETGPAPPPPTLLAKIVSPLHGLTSFTPPILFVLGVGLNGLEQPEWMLRFSFPSLGDDLGVLGTIAIRAAGCIASVACYRLFKSIGNHLGSQVHPIGVRFLSLPGSLPN